MPDNDLSSALQTALQTAQRDNTPLNLNGGGSKAFYGRLRSGQTLDINAHRGVVNYAPEELVITVRSGTPLARVEALLADKQQMLPFEPPHFGTTASIGGTVACGLSGPARPYRGAVRDHLLGCRIINGKGEQLKFGGEVMKNVAGYDVSRLMVGAQGTLGLLLEVSIKVLPMPKQNLTLCLEQNEDEALQTFSRLANQPLPLSAASHYQGVSYLRLSGSEAGVAAARAAIGGEELDNAAHFWQQEREQKHDFFANPEQPLWRFSLPPASAPLALPEQYLSWGGAQRWLRGDHDAALLRQLAQQHGGHAELFRGDSREADNLPPLEPGLLKLHQQVKHAFDPQGILNPGRLYQKI
ncbi:MAG: glycolate oxidase subunit GlcE [Gammaproteobacteria bacterium]|nr:glycolate oxidase subunit GlcE [Gammaproteobacteria bacterium]